MEGLKPFEVNGGLPTHFNSLLVSLTGNSLRTEELLLLMQVTEFNKYLSRKAYIHRYSTYISTYNRYSLQRRVTQHLPQNVSNATESYGEDF